MEQEGLHKVNLEGDLFFCVVSCRVFVLCCVCIVLLIMQAQFLRQLVSNSALLNEWW